MNRLIVIVLFPCLLAASCGSGGSRLEMDVGHDMGCVQELEGARSSEFAAHLESAIRKNVSLVRDEDKILSDFILHVDRSYTLVRSYRCVRDEVPYLEVEINFPNDGISNYRVLLLIIDSKIDYSSAEYVRISDQSRGRP